MTATIIDARCLNKTYTIGKNQVNAVADVSLTLKAGEFVALVGPSGAGKTTVLALLAGLLQADNGENLSRMKESERAAFRCQNIGFTFQNNNLVPYLTVLENVELMLGLNKKRNREIAKELLVRLGMEDLFQNLPSQLSGGQQQRVAIARALVHDPKLVLMDEPTASVDTKRAYQVVETFADLIHEQQRAGIMVTHDLRMCVYADRIIQMEDGHIANILTERAEIKKFVIPPAGAEHLVN
jgi:putative ABC transport system ATP-binding protein